MNPKVAAGLITLPLAAFALFPAPQIQRKTVNPTEADRLNNLGCAYMNQQLFEKGLAEFQQASEADPRLTIARLNQGIAYLSLQKTDEAKAALEDVLKQDPKNPNAWYSLGLIAKNTGDAQAAIDAFTHVTELDANDADTWYFVGMSYAQAKQFPQAMDAFHHALEINPRHASAEFGLSRSYQQSADLDPSNLDHAREHLKRFQYITQNKIGAPMSLAYGEQGQYSRAVESPLAQLKPPPQIKVQFVDVTKEAGIVGKADPGDLEHRDRAERFLGSGACFLDYDGDGLIDIFVADNGPEGGIGLYHNLGNGKFEDVTRKAGMDPQLHAIGCTAGDYDNDGATDLVLTTGARLILLHNEKNGTFKDVSQAAGIRSDGFSVGATFIDYDHDGDLDLYISRAKPSPPSAARPPFDLAWSGSAMLRNNGNGNFTDVTEETGLKGNGPTLSAIGTDYNNDRAVDLLTSGWELQLGYGTTNGSSVYLNPREGKFQPLATWGWDRGPKTAIAVLDFDHDGWMDIALTSEEGLSLWRNRFNRPLQAENPSLTNMGQPRSREEVPLPSTNPLHAFGVATLDYDNDGWVDLAVVAGTKDGEGVVRLFRNHGPDRIKAVTTGVGLDKIQLKEPRAIITGDYDNDGAVDLLITQNHGPAVLLRNEGGNQNHWLRLGLKGLNDNKSAIGTKVEVFSGGNRQKFEIYGSNGYLGQNSPYLTVGLGQSKEADIVRMMWPTGVLQDEIQVAGDRQQNFVEIDRRGSSCPTLFVWNGERYEFVADMLGAGVVGHWVGPNQRDIPRPVEYIKVDRNVIQEKASRACHPVRSEGPMHFAGSCIDPSPLNTAAQDDKVSGNGSRVLSFRFMEPLEEAVYLDQVRLLAVDHPAGVDVYPNEYFASNPPYPEFKVVVSRDARPPAGAWDEHGHDVLPDLLAHRYIGDFKLTQFAGFAQPHSLTLDLGEPYDGGPLWLLMHGEIEYFTANSMYAASQAGLEPFAPYVEALVGNEKGSKSEWVRVIDDMGFPAGGPRTMTADLTGRLPKGTRKIRITTNLQIYWDSILIDRTPQSATHEIPRRAPAPPPAKAVGLPESAGLRDDATGRDDVASSQDLRHPERSRSSGEAKDLARIGTNVRLTSVPLIRADLEYHGYPLKIEGTPPGKVQYIYEKASATGPYTRPVGTYTRYGDVLPLLTATDDKLVVFGSGDEIQLDFDPSNLPALPTGWVRDYFFAANGYEKDMDFYAAEGNYVSPLPFLSMGEYPYGPLKSFPLDDAHLNYLLEYNTRHMSGNEQRGYWFDYGNK